MTFQVIIVGDYQPGIEPQQAYAELARLTGRSLPQIARFLEGAPVTIKRGLDASQADRYKAVLEKAGFVCRMEEEAPVQPPLMSCPKCGEAHYEERLDCQRCGIVFHKFQLQLVDEPELDDVGDVDELDEEEGVYAARSIAPGAWKMLAVGAVAAAVVLYLPFINFVLGAFATLVHEFGHTVLAWLFGYPTIPAFDFRYGGGVALHFARSNPVLWVVYALFALLLLRYFRRMATLTLLIGVVALYSIMAFTSSHKVLLLFMGHGMELVFSTLFLFRALSGHATFHSAERSLYGFVGFLLQFQALQFVYHFFYDRAFHMQYLAGKGGITNDFVRISAHLRVDLDSVFIFFMFCALLPPLLAWLIYRYEPFWYPGFRRLFG